MIKLGTITFYAAMTAVLISCNGVKHEGSIIAVELQNNTESLEGARLVMLDPERPEKKAAGLVEGFYSSASPSLSHEGRYLYFQGKKEETDPWQIWVLDLKEEEISRVAEVNENCTYPASLPDGSVVFTREGMLNGQKVLNLWKCRMDGCCLTQLTHNPAWDTYSRVLMEGRVLYSSTQVFPEASEPRLMIMRPDGSKSELYSAGKGGLLPRSGGAESPDGHIYYISSDGQLSRVLHRRPLHTFENLSGSLGGSFHSVAAERDSTLLVSYMAVSSNLYGIYRFDPVRREAPEPLFPVERPLVQPVRIAAVDPRPRILPSPVDPGNPTALLMTQDINHSMLPVHSGITGDSVADRVRIFTLKGELSSIEAEDDGSVYMKLDADTPYRLETLNALGEVIRGPSDWIYLRPNERRACTGCHADPELAPRNYQPHAVKEEPVLLITGSEKLTSHEAKRN